MENKKNDKKKIVVRKKKKISFKKIKKAFIKLLNKLVDSFKKLWKKFIDLPKYVKYIIYVWAVIFVVVVTLILVSRNNNEFLKDYHNLEIAMSAGALDYVKTYRLYPVKENKLKLDLEFLREDNYVYSKDIKDKSCRGFAMVYYNDNDEQYVVDSYIDCNKYTTKGYNDYK